MDSSGSDSQKTENESPKVWTQLETVSKVETIDELMATLDDTQLLAEESTPEPPVPQLHCLESTDGTDYSSLMSVVNSNRMQKSYNPSLESRQLHNHKERQRRSRIKCSTDALRSLVPGVTDKTDKATVLEHTVHFVLHLSKCPAVGCKDYLPPNPPPKSAELMESNPNLMSGEYRYLESFPSVVSEDPNFDPNQSHIVEVHESNGTQYVTTSDGYQYVISLDNTDQQSAEPTDGQPLNTTTDNEFASNEQEISGNTPLTPKVEPNSTLESIVNEEFNKCVTQVINYLSEDKENIDPNADTTQKRQKRKYRKRQPKEEKVAVDSIVAEAQSNFDAVLDRSVSAGQKKRKQRVFKPKFKKQV